mmetsp:Transcript_7840/g.21358  ORF Transcript_7840/g.21358 Transcript_7840/m.21358 type:complete len:221 (-) Transcript_7840:774-1436(-)
MPPSAISSSQRVMASESIPSRSSVLIWSMASRYPRTALSNSKHFSISFIPSRSTNALSRSPRRHAASARKYRISATCSPPTPSIPFMYSIACAYLPRRIKHSALSYIAPATLYPCPGPTARSMPSAAINRVAVSSNVPQVPLDSSSTVQGSLGRTHAFPFATFAASCARRVASNRSASRNPLAAALHPSSSLAASSKYFFAPSPSPSPILAFPARTCAEM